MPMAMTKTMARKGTNTIREFNITPPTNAFDNVSSSSQKWGMYRLLELSDAASFAERTISFLLEHEAENNLIISSVLTLARTSARSPRLGFFIILKDEKVVAAALNSPDRRLLLSRCDLEVAAFLGEVLRIKGVRVKGILGVSDTARESSQSYLKPTEINKSHLNHVQNIMRLEKLNSLSTVNGRMRVAIQRDYAQLLRWSREFIAECGIDESIEQTETLVQKYLEARQFFIWDDGRATAMAGYGGNTPNGIRVNMVYTDKSVRGRGYASSLVYLLTRRLLSERHRFCFLFSDVNNTVSKHIYEKIGYHSVCEFTEYGFNVKTTG